MPLIIVLTGPNNGDYHPIVPDSIEIGRDPDCDLQLVDPTVSRRHLRLQLDESTEECRATNLSASSGVLVNNQSVTKEIRLQDGDLVQLGDTLLLYAVKDFPDVQDAVNYYRSAGAGAVATMMPDRDRVQ